MAKSADIELLEQRGRLLEFADRYDGAPGRSLLDGLCERTEEVGRSASGSWMGYQANVYFQDFQPPPAGIHFDIEHGIHGSYFSKGEPGWVEHTGKAVFEHLVDSRSAVALAAAEELARSGAQLVDDVKTEVASVLTIYLREHDDSFVRRLSEEIESEKIATSADIANGRSPKRQYITSDMRALQQGTWAPPHIKVYARVAAAHQPAAHCRAIAARLEKLAAHFGRVGRREIRASRVGTNVFIGHGRSFVWRDLKDFVKDRLSLPYDEFNRVPVAGFTNIARLSEMLDAAACAFVIMTAEDETADGSMQARMNVIHEVGLFQGRLGFTKAIVLLEEGCEEFSNIQGLGQIRFPKGNIAAKFEDIRSVLEREGVIES